MKMVAPWGSSEADVRSGDGYLFLTVMLLRPLKSMHLCSDLSFFSTKTKPAPSGEEDGRIIPAARDSEIYFSIASHSGLEKP